jgi:hypothetical protein
MIRGSCLCGSVTYELERAGEHFVLCHCHRCKKHSGSAFLAGLLGYGVRFLTGKDLISSYEAPVLVTPPAYRRDFCSRCGTAVPSPVSVAGEDAFIVPAGSLDADPEVRPQRHVWVDCEAAWEAGMEALPRLTEAEVVLDHARLQERTGGQAAVPLYEFIVARYGERPGNDAVVAAARERLAAIEDSSAGPST